MKQLAECLNECLVLRKIITTHCRQDAMSKFMEECLFDLHGLYARDKFLDFNKIFPATGITPNIMLAHKIGYLLDIELLSEQSEFLWYRKLIHSVNHLSLIQI